MPVDAARLSAAAWVAACRLRSLYDSRELTARAREALKTASPATPPPSDRARRHHMGRPGSASGEAARLRLDPRRRCLRPHGGHLRADHPNDPRHPLGGGSRACCGPSRSERHQLRQPDHDSHHASRIGTGRPPRPQQPSHAGPSPPLRPRHSILIAETGRQLATCRGPRFCDGSALPHDCGGRANPAEGRLVKSWPSDLVVAGDRSRVNRWDRRRQFEAALGRTGRCCKPG